MTLPSYPVGINSYAVLGTWSKAQDSRAPLSSQNNFGTTRRRNVDSMRIGKISFKITMSDADYEIFMDFFRGEIMNGANRFWMSVWDGTRYVERVVVFEKDFTPSTEEYARGYVRVGFKLEVENL